MGGPFAATHAQVLEVSTAAVLGVLPGPGAPAGGGADAALYSSVALRQVRIGATTLGVALSHSAGLARLWGVRTPPAAGTGAVQLDVNLAANETFGPLGNVIFEVAGSLRSDAIAQLDMTARGTIGPVAARLRLSAFGADQAVFAPAALASADRPSLGSAGVGAALGVTARFGRDVILDVRPELYLSAAGTAARLETRLRRLRTFGDNELRLYLDGALAPAWRGGSVASTSTPARWHAAVGAGVLWPRGRAPDLEVALLVGASGRQVTPGLRVSLAESLPGGVKVGLAGGFEPYRVDVHPLRVSATLEVPVTARGTLGFAVVAAALDRARPTAFALQSTFSIPVALP